MMHGAMEGGWRETGKATTAITGKRFCQKVAGGWKQCDTAGERVDGISVHDAVIGYEPAVFDILGVHSATSGAALIDGQEVMTNNAGKAIPLVADGANCVAGLCDHAVSAADLTTEIRHFAGGIQRAA